VQDIQGEVDIMAAVFDQLKEYLIQHPYFEILLVVLVYLLVKIFSPVITVPLEALKARLSPLFTKAGEYNRSIAIDDAVDGTQRSAPAVRAIRILSVFLACLRLVIKLGFVGWMAAGLWTLLSIGWVFIQIAEKAISAGWSISPANFLPIVMPTAVGLLLTVSGGFLLSFYRTYLEGEGPAKEFQQNLQAGCIFILMIFGAMISTAFVYRLLQIPVEALGLLILFLTVAFFTYSVFNVSTSLVIVFTIVFSIFFCIFCRSRVGIMTGALPFFFLLTFVYRIIPEVLLISRDKRHPRSDAVSDGQVKV
jgi:hypothetical protein